MPVREASGRQDVDALNKIENGRTPEAGAEPPKNVRRIDVDDLTALAAAVGVNPNALLLPHQGSGSITLTGMGNVDATIVWAWAEGRRPLTVPEGDDVETKIFDALPDETWGYPGHGDDTTLGAERPQLPEWHARGW